MNRPASTYVIIAHFTASGDFSQTKRGGEEKREWQRKQLVAIRAPLHHGPVNNGTSATAKWHFGIWVTISQLDSPPPPPCLPPFPSHSPAKSMLRELPLFK